MTAAASIQTDLKVTPLTDLPNAELIERAVSAAKVSLTKTGRLSLRPENEPVALQMIDLSLKSQQPKMTSIGAR